jgi:CRP/FNR family transcriptional regulator, cyclic AMP receptor protein
MPGSSLSRQIRSGAYAALPAASGAVPPEPQGLPDQLQRAVQRSCLAGLPAELIGAILAGGARLTLPAGAVLFRESGVDQCSLVLGGLLRFFRTAPDGRQVTTRYVVTGHLPGVATVVGSVEPFSLQAVLPSMLYTIDVRQFRAIGWANGRVAMRIAEELARNLAPLNRAIDLNVFGSARQRVVRHLLDLAAAAQLASEPAAPQSRPHGLPGSAAPAAPAAPARALVAPVTQQALAAAAGTAREVVGRVVRDLRLQGLVKPTRGGVILLDPARLACEADLVWGTRFAGDHPTATAGAAAAAAATL